MIFYTFVCSIVGFALSSQADPCSVLCRLDGRTVCSGGSWSKNGICHAYYFRGDPSLVHHCYHTSRTKESCPSSGTPVRLADAQGVIERLQRVNGAAATTTSSTPSTSSSSVKSNKHATSVTTSTRPAPTSTNLGVTANLASTPAESVEARVAQLRGALPDVGRFFYGYLDAPADNAFFDSYQQILELLTIEPLRFPETRLSARLQNQPIFGRAAKREFFSSVFSQIFNPESGLFLSNGEVPQYMRINPAGREQPNYQNIYRAVGRYLAVSITFNQAVGESLPVYFFSYILGRRQLDLDDIRQDEPMLSQTLEYLLTCPASELEFMPLMVGAGETVVATDETRQYVVYQKLNSLIRSHELMALISQGFREVIPLDILQRFLSPIDLKNLILGTPEIDVEDLVRNILWDSNSRVAPLRARVERVLRSFNQAELVEFMRFATNLQTVPFGGFGDVNPRIRISREISTTKLPRVFQCQHTVLLPEYSSDAEMREKLLTAFYESNWGL